MKRLLDKIADPYALVVTLLLALLITQQALWYFQQRSVHEHRERNELLHSVLCDRQDTIAKYVDGPALPPCPLPLEDPR